MLLTSRDGASSTSVTKLYKRGDSVHAFFPVMVGLDQGNMFSDETHVGNMKDNLIPHIDGMDARFRDTMALVRLSEEVKDRLDDILEKFPYLHGGVCPDTESNITDGGVYIGNEHCGKMIPVPYDNNSDFRRIQLAKPIKKLKALTGTKQLIGLPMVSQDGRLSGTAMGTASKDDIMSMYNYPIESLQRMEAQLGLTELSSVQ